MTSIELSRILMQNGNNYYRELFGKLFASLYECKRTANQPNWKLQARKVKRLLKEARTTDQLISAINAFQGSLKHGADAQAVAKIGRYADLFITAIRAMDEGSLEEIKAVATSTNLNEWKAF